MFGVQGFRGLGVWGLWFRGSRGLGFRVFILEGVEGFVKVLGPGFLLLIGWTAMQRARRA